MFNERIMNVFDAVMKYLTAGEYVVVPKTNVRDALEGFSQAEIDTALNTLQMNELIQIRYADSEVYCLTVLPKGIREDERREEAREEERRKQALLEAERAKREAKAKEAAAAAEEKGSDGETAAVSSEEKPTDREKPPTEKETITKVISATKPFNYVKAAIICGVSAFLGAFIAGMIALGIIVGKVG